MMRLLSLLFLFLLTGYLGSTQNISGQIVDKKTNQPLPYASIIYKNKFLGTTSNEQGYFELNSASLDKSDTIKVSYLGYMSKSISIEELSKNRKIKLEPRSIALDEITVSSEKFKLKTFMKETIEKYNLNLFKEPNLAMAHYREKAKKDGEYIMYMESIGYALNLGYQKDVAPLSNYKFFCENSKAHIENPQWKKYAYEDGDVMSTSSGITLNFLRLLEVRGLLSEKKYKDFEFTLDSTYVVNNLTVYRVGFENKEAYGTMDVVEENNQILEIDYHGIGIYSVAIYDRVHSDVNIRFSYFNKTPYVASIKSVYDIDGLRHSNDLTILTQKYNTFDLNYDEYWNLGTYDVYPFLEYNPDEWKRANISKDPEYHKIEKDLTHGEFTLESYFIKNSGRWLNEKSTISEETRQKIINLKKNF